MNERPNGYRYYMFTTSYSTSCTCTDAAGMSAGYLSNYRNLIALLHRGWAFFGQTTQSGYLYSHFKLRLDRLGLSSDHHHECASVFFCISIAFLTAVCVESPEDTYGESCQRGVPEYRPQIAVDDGQGRQSTSRLSCSNPSAVIVLQHTGDKLSDPFYDSLDGLLGDLRTVTIVCHVFR